MIRLVRRRPFTVAGVLVLIHIGCALLTFQPQPHTGGDNAAYITLAGSLLERGAYLELWDPASPPHTKYPPVFPAALALALALGLTPFAQLKLVVLAFSAAAVAASFLWMRGRRRYGLALGVGLLLAVAPGVLREGRWILSDVPFWCFTMLALWALDRLRPGAWLRFGLAAAAVLLAYFTRSAGLPLVLAALAWLAWRRLWPQLGVLALTIAIPGALWWLRTRTHGPAGYVSEFWLVNPYVPAAGRIGVADLFARMAENAGKYASVHLPILLAGRESALLTLLAALVLLLGLAGWLQRALRPGTLRTADLFLPMYLGLILVWPAVWSGERFLLPVLPLVLFYAGDQLVRGVRWAQPRFDFVAGAAVLLLMMIMAAPALAQAVSTGRTCTALYRAGERYPCLPGSHWQDFFDMAEWTTAALPDEAVVLSRKPRLYYVLSGLRSANYPLDPEPDRFFETVQQTGARYVVFDRLDAVSELYLRPVLTRRPGAFCVLRVAGPSGTLLFGILPGWAAAPDGGLAALQRPEDVRFDVCGEEYWRSAEARERLRSVQ